MNSSSSPLVSVCIPSYNSARHIREAIQSVLDQDYSNIELIIVDDASSDSSREVIEESILKNTYPVIYKVNLANLGLAGNWNKALSLASGKYIKVLPCDDKLHAHCISKQVDILERHDNAVLAFSSRRLIDENGREKFSINLLREGIIRSKTLAVFSVLLGTNPVGEPGAVLFRSEVANRIGKFDDSLPYVIDVDYWLRLLEHGDGYKSSKPLSFFRISDNLSVTLGSHRYKNYQAFISKVCERYSISRFVGYIGKFQAFINDIIRRAVHRLVFGSR